MTMFLNILIVSICLLLLLTSSKVRKFIKSFSKISKMSKVEEFDEVKYTKEKFDIVMDSIQSDNDWEATINDYYIAFHKILPNGSKSITFELQYEFNKDLRDEFVIKDPSVLIRSSSFRIYGKVDNKMKKYIYTKYSNWMNSENEIKRQSVDKKLDSFGDILGKSHKRNKRLNDLLK